MCPRAGIFVYGQGRAAARPGQARNFTGRAQLVPTLKENENREKKEGEVPFTK